MFTAYSVAAHPFLDLEYAPDPMTYRFHLRVDNNSGITRYIQVVSTIPNWSVSSPTDGKLGAVGGAETKHVNFTLSRAKPGGAVDDTGQLIMKIYADSGYTVLVEQNPLDVTMSVVNIKGGTFTEWNFNDGTLMGWVTNGAISSEEFMGISGYSVRNMGSGDRYLQKSVAIPSGSHAAGMFYYKAKNYNTTTTKSLNRFWVVVDSYVMWDWQINFNLEDIGGNGETPWRKIVFDLTAYAGTTKTINILANSDPSYVPFFIDNIVVGAW